MNTQTPQEFIKWLQEMIDSSEGKLPTQEQWAQIVWAVQKVNINEETFDQDFFTTAEDDIMNTLLKDVIGELSRVRLNVTKNPTLNAVINGILNSPSARSKVQETLISAIAQKAGGLKRDFEESGLKDELQSILKNINDSLKKDNDNNKGDGST